MSRARAIYIYILWREEQTTDTVGVASGLGEAFIQQNYKNNVSKGVKVSRINRGSGVLVVLRWLLKEGSVREGRVQVRGGVRRPHALPSRVRGARGGGFVLLLARGASRGIRPGILARQPSHGCGARPSTLPSWTHGDTSVHARGRDRSPEERRARHITAAVMTWLFSAPLLSHTPTPVGSLVKGGD